jgi:hypothetical protein
MVQQISLLDKMNKFPWELFCIRLLGCKSKYTKFSSFYIGNTAPFVLFPPTNFYEITVPKTDNIQSPSPRRLMRWRLRQNPRPY